MQGILIVLGMSVLIISYTRERKKVARKRILMVIIAFVIECLFFIINIFNITNVYDFTMIGSVLGMVFMFISIFRYNLLGTRDIARDFMVDRLSEGVIAIDNERLHAGAREHAQEIIKDPDCGRRRIRAVIYISCNEDSIRLLAFYYLYDLPENVSLVILKIVAIKALTDMQI